MHDRIMQICTYDLFQFAYIPSWYEQLYELSQLAAPEPWRFRQPSYETQNTETPILERYINQVFRKQAIDYSCAPEGQAGQIFYLNQEFACFHTGLNTKDYKSIYMCFNRNKRLDSLRKWCFKGFTTEDSPWFKYVLLLPSRPTYAMRQWMTYYDPEWEIRVNASHILEDEENAARLPESIRVESATAAGNSSGIGSPKGHDRLEPCGSADFSKPCAIPAAHPSDEHGKTRSRHGAVDHGGLLHRPYLPDAGDGLPKCKTTGPAYGWVARRACGVIRRRLAGKEFL